VTRHTKPSVLQMKLGMLFAPADFRREWERLSAKDRADLLAWTEVEK